MGAQHRVAGLAVGGCSVAAVSVSKEELHRLVELLPEGEVIAGAPP